MIVAGRRSAEYPEPAFRNRHGPNAVALEAKKRKGTGSLPECLTVGARLLYLHRAPKKRSCTATELRKENQYSGRDLGHRPVYCWKAVNELGLGCLRLFELLSG
jgi:hypothetical protein